MLEPRAFVEVVRTVSVQYPIPFILACLLVFALLCFGGSAAATAPLSWMLAVTGCASAACALVLVIYATVWKTELLRSERHSLLSRAFDVMLDKRANRNARSKAGQIVEGFLLADATTSRVPRPPVEGGTTSSAEDENE